MTEQEVDGLQIPPHPSWDFRETEPGSCYLKPLDSIEAGFAHLRT